MISKGCPKCKNQVAVACKACPCGHIFFTARNRARTFDNLLVASAGASGEIQGQRRTERVKREKPKFYDSLQYENKLKKRRKPKITQPVYEEEKDEEDEDSDPKGKKRRIIKKIEEDEDPMVNLPNEKLQQCSIELAELNRKIFSVSWKA
ncbi:UPF0547 protein C16orf87 homolog [Neocloeon triangulifer]|uniref:UPF0547 protein C16orf87 homolog n=1 Tax=Neocloeon triangulifer TaxID=2078957 RepID=UPI00286F310A|nr:UPF0547 protein C16orf87 homolog [Neocloeon triangulifer]